ncbi:MAG TPA: hypothetical protein VJ142_00325 [Candidatus Nanoarchaeia archaeon]|nr:hypothetical protein [Candidatus Nanoarchaeia archaeon]
MECSVCGISGKMRSVSEVISPKGVILACGKCALEEGFPILKKPDKRVFEEPKKGSVYERLSRLSGVKHVGQQERPELKKEEESLRKIIDRNYGEKMRRQDLSLKSRPDLIDKFHWIIMRVRRVKGFTQKQLAEAIKETEAAIKMAEQGIVPEGYDLMDKLERFLRVKLIKERTSSRLGQSKERNLYRSSGLNKNQTNSNIIELKEKTRLSVAELKERNQQAFSQPQKIPEHSQKTLGFFDKQNLDSLTIADLQRMRREREENRLSVADLEREAEMWEDEEKEAENDK